jgi:hypothetical protein
MADLVQHLVRRSFIFLIRITGKRRRDSQVRDAVPWRERDSLAGSSPMKLRLRHLPDPAVQRAGAEFAAAVDRAAIPKLATGGAARRRFSTQLGNGRRLIAVAEAAAGRAAAADDRAHAWAERPAPAPTPRVTSTCVAGTAAISWLPPRRRSPSTGGRLPPDCPHGAGSEKLGQRRQRLFVDQNPRGIRRLVLRGAAVIIRRRPRRQLQRRRAEGIVQIYPGAPASVYHRRAVSARPASRLGRQPLCPPATCINLILHEATAATDIDWWWSAGPLAAPPTGAILREGPRQRRLGGVPVVITRAAATCKATVKNGRATDR